MSTNISLDHPGCIQIRIQGVLDERLAAVPDEIKICRQTRADDLAALQEKDQGLNSLAFPPITIESSEPSAVQENAHPRAQSSCPFALLQ